MTTECWKNATVRSDRLCNTTGRHESSKDKNKHSKPDFHGFPSETGWYYGGARGDSRRLPRIRY